MVGPRQTDDAEILRQASAMWDAAKSELARLREEVQRAVDLGKAQASLAQVRNERDLAVQRLGEQVFRMIEAEELVPPAALRRSLADVRARDAERHRHQADIAAVLREADALADRDARRGGARKKK
jgi:hypothetical protein